MVDDGLIDALCDAVRRSLALILEAHRDETLIGYALCTDDDLSGVFHVACTRQFCERYAGGDPQVELLPNEWMYSEGRELFDGPRQLVRARAASADSRRDYATHRSATFEAFVRAMERVRAEGAFPRSALLVVMSTDPCGFTERLAVNAVERLNPRDVADHWVGEMGYTNLREAPR